MLIMPYDTESQSRNADFILIALRAIPHPLNLLNLLNLLNPFPPVSLCLTASPTGTSSHIFLFQLVPTRSSLFHGNGFSPMEFCKVVPPCPILFQRLFHRISQSPSCKTGQWNKWNKILPIEIYKRKEGCKWHMYDIYTRARGACSMGRCC